MFGLARLTVPFLVSSSGWFGASSGLCSSGFSLVSYSLGSWVGLCLFVPGPMTVFSFWSLVWAFFLILRLVVAGFVGSSFLVIEVAVVMRGFLLLVRFRWSGLLALVAGLRVLAFDGASCGCCSFSLIRSCRHCGGFLTLAGFMRLSLVGLNFSRLLF